MRRPGNGTAKAVRLERAQAGAAESVKRASILVLGNAAAREHEPPLNADSYSAHTLRGLGPELESILNRAVHAPTLAGISTEPLPVPRTQYNAANVYMNSPDTQRIEHAVRVQLAPLETPESGLAARLDERAATGAALLRPSNRPGADTPGQADTVGPNVPERLLPAAEPSGLPRAVAEPRVSAVGQAHLPLDVEAARPESAVERTYVMVKETAASPAATPPPSAPVIRELDASQSPVAKASPFRTKALQAKTEEPVAETLPQVSGSTWTVLVLVSTLLLVAIVLAYFGHVEETSIAGGVLLVRGGPRPVLAQVSGVVTALDVAPGEMVEAGQSVARIDATELNARVQRASEQLALVSAEQGRVIPAKAQRYQAEVRLLERKRELLNDRARLKALGIHDREDRMEQIEHATRAGVASQADALGVREAARSASEELLLIRQQITEIDLTLTADKRAYDTDQEQMRRELDEAKSNLAQARSMLEMTTVRAPVAGRMESLLATQGQVVNNGTIMARIIPDGAVTSAVVFAPVKDASFLVPGLEANIEFASFPVSEFGRAPGRVTRVSPDVASIEEATSVLGQAPQETGIRVEIELLSSPELFVVQSKLRSGERLTARLNTRERRLIALVFDFLRKWYEP